MQDLTLNELVQGTQSFLSDEKAPLFEATHASLTYRPILVDLVARAVALPAALRGRPLAFALRGADKTHDGWLRTLFYFKESLRWCPTPTPTTAAVVAAIEQHFGISLADVGDTYAENIAKAGHHAAQLEKSGDLFATVGTPDGRTLKAWFEDFIASGREAAVLLTSRGDVVAESDRGEAGVLRLELLGVLSELRTVLRRETAARPELPKHLDETLFGTLDALQTLAAARNAKSPAATQDELPTK